MLILIHTSKTMHALDNNYVASDSPLLMDKTKELARYMQGLTEAQLEKVMSIKAPLAKQVHATYQTWSPQSDEQRTAIHSFAGDIYSGLQIDTWTQKDLHYAQEHLIILSGLYGALRPLDGIMPYRLELGYRLPEAPYKNLYDFWGNAAAKQLPSSDIVIDLAAKEYSKLVLPHLSAARVITPKFMTVNAKTGEPGFVVVHAKIARGAFAAWLVRDRVKTAGQLKTFAELGYSYDEALSTADEPVFICRQFGGIGLSVRLKHRS